MSLSDYAGLKQAIVDHLERPDLSGFMDDFIDLAEARIATEIRIREMEAREDLAIAADARYVSLPADFLDLKYFRIQVPSSTYSGRMYLPNLHEVSLDELTQKSIQDAYCPTMFAIWNEQIQFDTKADQAYTGELHYYAELTALSDDNTSTGLLVRSPGAYLYAALSATAPFLMSDERLQTWDSMYTTIRDSLNRSEREHRRGGPLAVRLPNKIY